MHVIGCKVCVREAAMVHEKKKKSVFELHLVFYIFYFLIISVTVLLGLIV